MQCACAWHSGGRKTNEKLTSTVWAARDRGGYIQRTTHASCYLNQLIFQLRIKMLSHLTDNMSSSQTQQPDAQQRRHPHFAHRTTSESFEPDIESVQRTNSIGSTSPDESKLSHYLHYEDNACFFAADGQDGGIVRDRGHSVASP
ncbi:uncharacterized protein BDV14DRAFT_92632 [Aspergillus stella-maris]|uniref:uncharacterized protein n=1 Tax=Aspergillus stella-maris TaxID=1810926 RepID=UPI003CCDC077